MRFFKDQIADLIQDGHTVDIATNETDSPVPEFYRELGCKIYPIACERSPLHAGNRKAIGQIRELVEQNGYDIVHCHTPIAAMCTRLACRKARKKGTKVFYTAHGFHFYKGAPLKNWVMYYPVEWVCAHFTDVLITINREDYHLAQKRMRAKRAEYVPGVGIDLDRFTQTQVDRQKKRREIEVPEDAFLLLSVGELNENKNHQLVIRALAEIKDPLLHYAIAGQGPMKEELESLAQTLGVGDRVHLLGYRRDVAELNQIADTYVLPSFREGLNVSVMEAMASGLPCAVSEIRGNIDLIDENGGVLFDPHSEEDCRRAISDLKQKDRNAMGRHNESRVKNFSMDAVLWIMRGLYGLG